MAESNPLLHVSLGFVCMGCGVSILLYSLNLYVAVRSLYRPQFWLDRLGRYIKLFLSTVIPFSHAVASQFGLVFFL